MNESSSQKQSKSTKNLNSSPAKMSEQNSSRSSDAKIIVAGAADGDGGGSTKIQSGNVNDVNDNDVHVPSFGVGGLQQQPQPPSQLLPPSPLITSQSQPQPPPPSPLITSTSQPPSQLPSQPLPPSPLITSPAPPSSSPAHSQTRKRHARNRSRDGKFNLNSIGLGSGSGSMDLDRSIRSFNTLSSHGTNKTKRKGISTTTTTTITPTKLSANTSIASASASFGQGPGPSHSHGVGKDTKRRSSISAAGSLSAAASVTSAAIATSSEHGNSNATNAYSASANEHSHSHSNPPQSFLLNPKVKIPKMKESSQCQLFCAFYAEFDNIVGPKVCFQSPRHFLDHDIAISTEEAEQLLTREFHLGSDDDDDEDDDDEDDCDDEEESNEHKDNDVAPQNESNNREEPINDTIDGSMAAASKSNRRKKDGKEAREKPVIPSHSNSIFDSTCEYIITGNELTGQIISLSTHNMHIITRPTIIQDSKYERNSLLFSVGFVIRRKADPSPFRPLLERLATTLQSMEVESQFLSSPTTKPLIQEFLDVIVPSLNSPSSKCHLLLDGANALHMQYFPPPKAHAKPVPEYAVPVLLRPEYQLQNLSWDLTINWIIPYIDGIQYAKTIAGKSKVDEEMVLSCLRVLRHHNVLACIDIFRYSNVYESTLKAQQMLAGDMDGLLHEAFDFVANVSKPSTAHSVTSSNAYHSAGSSNGSGGNLTASYKTTGTIQSTDQPEGTAMTLLPPMDPASPSSYPPVNTLLKPQSISQCSSSYTNTPSGPGIYMVSNPPCNNSGTPSNKNSVHQSPSSLPPPMSASTSAQHRASHLIKEKQIMMAALAILYSSCQRNITIGEVWLNKAKQSRVYAPNDGVPHTVVDESLTANGRSKKGSSSRKKKTSSKIRSISMGSTSSAFTGIVGKIDWGEAFEFFNHRRFVTFGVIHGLIRRVHEFPIAIDKNVGGDKDEIEDNMNNTDASEDDEDVEDDENVVNEEEETLVFKNTHFTNRNQKPPAYMTMRRHKSFGQRTSVSPSFSPKFSPTISPQPQKNSDSLRTSLRASSPQLHSQYSPLSTSKGQQVQHIPPPQFSLGPNAVDGPAAASVASYSSTSSFNHPRTSASVQSISSVISLRSSKVVRKLANKIAESMDGTRSDDELCVIYQRNMKELKSLVKKNGKKEIISIYSTSK